MKIQELMCLNQKEEMFTHKDTDGTFRHFPVRFMFELAEKYFGMCPDIIHGRVPIEKGQVKFIRKNMGIEQERLDRLCEPYLSRPIIGILWDDNTTMTIIDGNHRYVKLWELGIREMKAHVFKHPFWLQFCIPLKDDEGRLKKRSMMLEYEAGLAREN